MSDTQKLVTETGLRPWTMFIEFPVATAVFIIASLNLAYRPMWLITIASLGLLLACYQYFKLRHGIRIPVFVLFLAFAAVEIDTVGNHFRWYQKLPWPVPYDVFAHLLIPTLLAPALFWLIRSWFERMSYFVPLSVITFIATNVNFSLSGFYEITELWDELYFGGKRIWGIYDTSRDLQWDLIGALLGSIATFLFLKFSALFAERSRKIPGNSAHLAESISLAKINQNVRDRASVS